MYLSYCIQNENFGILGDFHRLLLSKNFKESGFEKYVKSTKVENDGNNLKFRLGTDNYVIKNIKGNNKSNIKGTVSNAICTFNESSFKSIKVQINDRFRNCIKKYSTDNNGELEFDHIRLLDFIVDNHGGNLVEYQPEIKNLSLLSMGNFGMRKRIFEIINLADIILKNPRLFMIYMYYYN